MKIAMLIPSYHPIVGGAERQLELLSRELKAQCKEVFVVTRRKPSGKKHIKIHNVDVYRTFCHFHTISFLISSFLFLSKNRNRFKIIHIHTLNSPILVGVFLKFLFKKKLVIKIPRSGNGSMLELLLNHPLKKHLLCFYLKHADRVIALNHETFDNLIKFGVAKEKIAAISNGVDTDEYNIVDQRQKNQYRKELGINENFILTFTGRLVSRKNVDIILKCLRQLTTNNYKFIVIGDGPQMSKLKAMVSNFNLRPKVLFLGSLDREMVRKYLQCSDIFILPSQSEGISNAILEAMSCGNAVIASSIPGNIDLIKDRENGLLFGLQKYSKLEELINFLVKDKDALLRLKKNANDTIKKHFSIKRISEKYIAVYNSLLSE